MKFGGAHPHSAVDLGHSPSISKVTSLRLPSPVLCTSYRGSARFRTRLRLPRAIVIAASRPRTNIVAGLF
jgi:hypothetical protein